MDRSDEMFSDYRNQNRPVQNEVYIEGFPAHWSSEHLKNDLRSRNVGEILTVRVIPARFDKPSFAFVQFEEDIENIILQLNHRPAYFDGRRMIVSRARTRPRLPERPAPPKGVTICTEPVELGPLEPPDPIRTISVLFSNVENLDKIYFILSEHENLRREIESTCAAACGNSENALDQLPAKNRVFTTKIDEKPVRVIVLEYLTKTSVKVESIDSGKISEVETNSIYRLDGDILSIKPIAFCGSFYGLQQRAFTHSTDTIKVIRLLSKAKNLSIESKGCDQSGHLYFILYSTTPSGGMININEKLERQNLMEKTETLPELTEKNDFITELLKTDEHFENGDEGDEFVLETVSIDSDEILTMVITHFSERDIREGEILLHLRNVDQVTEYNKLIGWMQVYYESEKVELRNRNYDFDEIEFVMFVLKGPMGRPICLRGEILHDEISAEGSLRIYAIDVGFEMNVNIKHCFELAEQFKTIPILSYKVKAVGIEINSDQTSDLVEELKRIKQDVFEMRCQFQNSEPTYNVHIPSLNDILVRKGFNSTFF